MQQQSQQRPAFLGHSFFSYFIDPLQSGILAAASLNSIQCVQIYICVCVCMCVCVCLRNIVSWFGLVRATFIISWIIDKSTLIMVIFPQPNVTFSCMHRVCPVDSIFFVNRFLKFPNKKCDKIFANLFFTIIITTKKGK